MLSRVSRLSRNLSSLRPTRRNGSGLNAERKAPAPPSQPRKPIINTNTNTNTNTTQGVLYTARQWTIILAAPVWAHLLLLCFGWPHGASMLPTLHVAGDYIFISPLHRRGRGVRVGDVVSALHPEEPGQAIVKRVVAMPGDFVCTAGVADAGLAVTGRMQDHDDDDSVEDGGPDDGDVEKLIQVPEGHCFLAGDNQSASRDSRYYGPVPLALIEGKVMAVVLPWSRMKWLRNPVKPVDQGEFELG